MSKHLKKNGQNAQYITLKDVLESEIGDWDIYKNLLPGREEHINSILETVKVDRKLFDKLGKEFMKINDIETLYAVIVYHFLILHGIFLIEQMSNEIVEVLMSEKQGGYS